MPCLGSDWVDAGERSKARSCLNTKPAKPQKGVYELESLQNTTIPICLCAGKMAQRLRNEGTTKGSSTKLERCLKVSQGSMWQLNI